MTRPFHTFIFKIFSRCNLNCTYCYMYNLADTAYREQPGAMSPETVRKAVSAIRAHLDEHGKTNAQFVLHGGEPLLGRAGYLQSFFGIVDEILSPDRYEIRIGIQSNGTLFTRQIGDVLLNRDAGIGISLDGPPAANDRYRVDHRGRGSAARVERALQVLGRDPYRRIFGGFLVVVDVENDPVETYEYLAGFSPPSISFLLPYDNHDRRPKGKSELAATPYADWLIPIFDRWWSDGSPVRIRELDNLIRLLLGGRSRVESFGLDPVDIIVIETNGDIEAVDSLKGTYHGATRLGFNVGSSSLTEVLEHNLVRLRREGLGALAATCTQCELVRTCGSGYLPNRWSAENGFRNPSVYCSDLTKLIRHIYHVIRTDDARTIGRRSPAALPGHLDAAPY